MTTRSGTAKLMLLAAMALGCGARQAAPNASAPHLVDRSAAPDAGAAPMREIDKIAPAGGPAIPAVLTDAPEVPPAIHRSAPAHVVVDLEVSEVTMPIAEGVDYTFWTFGGKVPGKFIRVRQYDTVELHLRNNRSSKMPHNIDLHAVSGPGGGAASTFTAPGHSSTFTFKALNAGLFVYHCAAPPVGMHIANGMYGMILVEPPEGLPAVDHEYYVMQGDFYTVGAYHERGLQPFDTQKAIDEKPTYVLFNGAEGALTGDHALKAKAGERVRLFVGNGGPNLVSSFHVIGAVFDKVFTEGGSSFQSNVQTTLIPSGGAAVVELTPQVPGNYALVDHSIFRTFNKGALGMLSVSGLEDRYVYSGKQADEVIAEKVIAQPTAPVALKPPTERGKVIFDSVCASCHQADAKGLPGAFPPLAGSDFLMADKARSIGVVLHGLSGPVVVNGQRFTNVMPPQAHLTDAEIADVLTYLRKSFGNAGAPVSVTEVVRERRKGSATADF